MEDSKLKSIIKSNSLKGLLLTGTIISGFAFATSAIAQDAPKSEEVVVVTGSRLIQTNPLNATATSPVTAISAVEIKASGVTRVEDLVNDMPQAFAAQNANVSNGATGTATVNLRGLGASRTLVLVDGRRLPYGSPLSVPADLNSIPTPLVARVDVLTGGASAVYGSDAIAGVVNFIMRKDINGIEINAQHGYYAHSNDYDGPGNLRAVLAAKQATNPSQFKMPADDVITGRSTEISLALGSNLADDKGHITAYMGYRNNAAVLQKDFDYSACTIGGVAGNGTDFVCGGSSTSYPGRFTDFATFNKTIDTAGTGNDFRNFASATDQYNYGPTNYYQRPDERYIFGAYGNYEINKNAELFTSLMFTDYSSVAQIAPSGVFGVSTKIGCNNPLLSAQQAATFGCTAADIAAGTIIDNTGDNGGTTYVYRRNVEGGPRQDDLHYQTFRGVVGLKGDLLEGFTYDLSAQYSRVEMTRTYLNEFSIKRSSEALDVVPDPVTGAPICRVKLTDSASACVPYNIWKIGGVTQAALNYVSGTGVQTGNTTQSVVTYAIQGDLGKHGIKSPWAEDGVQVGFGIEQRREGIVSVPDYEFYSGDLAGQGGPTIGLQGSTSTTDLFFEGKIPLVNGKPFAYSLGLDTAYRASKLSSGKSVTTYKVGLDWAPVQDIRFRGSYQKAARAANVIEMFAAQGAGLTSDIETDPCSDAGALVVGSALRTRCLATGVPVGNLGNGSVLDSPAQQYNGFFGGNPNLNPETSETKTIGFQFRPTFLKGLNISVDWFDITVEGLISTVGTYNTLNACYALGDAASCAKIVRAPSGSLWAGNGYIQDLNTNIGGLATTGVDVNAVYRLNLADFGLEKFGKLDFNLVGTYLDKLETDPGVPGLAKYDCVGKFGGNCGTPNPQWRHRLRTAWLTPWNVTLSTTWRYYGDVTNGGTAIGSTLPEYNYIDLGASINLKNDLVLRAGIDNVLDDDPPMTAVAGTNGNTYPQIYDSLGRFMFVGVTKKF